MHWLNPLAQPPTMQVLPEQEVTWPGTAQLWPQLPQLLSSVSVFTQASPQGLNPALHEETVQDPETHAGVPFAAVQTCPHEPQFCESDVVSMHAPPQRPNPGLHEAMPQVPFAQEGRPFGTKHA